MIPTDLFKREQMDDESRNEPGGCQASVSEVNETIGADVLGGNLVHAAFTVGRVTQDRDPEIKFYIFCHFLVKIICRSQGEQRHDLKDTTTIGLTPTSSRFSVLRL